MWSKYPCRYGSHAFNVAMSIGININGIPMNAIYRCIYPMYLSMNQSQYQSMDCLATDLTGKHDLQLFIRPRGSMINDQRSITINHDQLMDNDQSSVNDQWSTINQSAEAAASRKGRKDRCQTTKNASIPASLSTGSSPLESHTRGTQPSSSTEHLQQEPLSPSHHTISCDGWWWYGMVWYGICPPSRRTTTTTTTILMIYMTIPQVN